MRNRPNPILLAVLSLLLIPAGAFAQIAAYSQDFELLDGLSTSALADDGWLVFGIVYDTDATTFLGQYGPFPAPNDGFAFCQIDNSQGGPEQGFQQLVVFSDYNNGDHALGRYIESITYREWTITEANVGQRWTFAFQAKKGNIELLSTAQAFIKVIDPNNSYALTTSVVEDMTSIPVEWGGWSLQLDITQDLVGQIFQIGFSSLATLYQGAGIFYDNIEFSSQTGTDAPNAATRQLALKQNSPNPFNPTTRIEFSLAQPGYADLSIYDLAGRRVATLQQSNLDAGDHFVDWDGRNDSGARVASGNYRYVLRTAQGQAARGMTLLK